MIKWPEPDDTYCGVNYYTEAQLKQAVRDAYEDAAKPSQALGVEPVYQYQLANGNWIDQTKESYDYNVKHGQATVRMLYATPQAAAEPVKFPRDGIRGVRAQDDTVIIKVMGNQRARELCHKLLTDREQEPGGNPNAFNKWS